MMSRFYDNYALIPFGFSAPLAWCPDCALAMRQCPLVLSLFSNDGNPIVRQLCADILRFFRFSHTVPLLCVDYALMYFKFAAFLKWWCPDYASIMRRFPSVLPLFSHGAPILCQLFADALRFIRFSHIVPRLCVGYAPMSIGFAAFLAWCPDSASIMR